MPGQHWNINPNVHVVNVPAPPHDGKKIEGSLKKRKNDHDEGRRRQAVNPNPRNEMRCMHHRHQMLRDQLQRANQQQVLRPSLFSSHFQRVRRITNIFTNLFCSFAIPFAQCMATMSLVSRGQQGVQEDTSQDVPKVTGNCNRMYRFDDLETFWSSSDLPQIDSKNDSSYFFTGVLDSHAKVMMQQSTGGPGGGASLPTTAPEHLKANSRECEMIWQKLCQCETSLSTHDNFEKEYLLRYYVFLKCHENPDRKSWGDDGRLDRHINDLFRITKLPRLYS